jgi:hypothetical protein
MSRSRLSLFAVDEAALKAFGDELRATLTEDDRDAVVRLLELSGPGALYVKSVSSAADVFLASEDYAASAPVFAALRLAARERALKLAWTSDALSLEGRLRAFEALREDARLAARVDRLLNGESVPWFLRRSGDTCGWVGDAERRELAQGLAGLDDPPEELSAFARGLEQVNGRALCHDTLL